MSGTRKVAVAVAAIGLLAMPVAAQRGRGGGGMDPRIFSQLGGSAEFYTPPDFHGNPAYDGRFTFARIKYRGFAKFSREGPGWSHDFPDAEEHLMRIMRDITILRPFIESGEQRGGVIVALDDPLLFKYPVAYLSEPGGWFPNDKEAKGMRDYLLKGGFVVFDDFREVMGRRGGGLDWTNLREQMARVLPNARWVQLTGNEPIFDSFFKIDLEKTISRVTAYGPNRPTWWALYENNDPKKRIMVIADVDNDVGEAWQWSGTGFVAIPDANEAFKLGVNYLIYALVH